MRTRSDIDFGSAARARNLLDPAAPQDAATRAYVDAVLGWQDLELAVPEAVAAIEFAPIAQTYSDLRLVLEGIRHDGAANQQFTLAVSPDGATFSNAQNVTGVAPATATMFGAIEIAGYRLDCGAIPASTANHPVSPAIGQGGSLSAIWRCTGGIRGLRVSVTGGAAFAGGTLRLQARR